MPMKAARLRRLNFGLVVSESGGTAEKKTIARFALSLTQKMKTQSKV